MVILNFADALEEQRRRFIANTPAQFFLTLEGGASKAQAATVVAAVLPQHWRPKAPESGYSCD